MPADEPCTLSATFSSKPYCRFASNDGSTKPVDFCSVEMGSPMSLTPSKRGLVCSAYWMPVCTVTSAAPRPTGAAI
ncbi:MAG: hypothetical protein DI536_02870 [Archangium gephyra]|uniref:Uncharacterized protein n=1 Tax=Archangium gephyra TaxID=48 RepID=A0A2W5VND2_9BACT|nr:MAG: hypothetical protein DI536_02870 [Archangium gephyra]